jgi:hypothetical protein
MIVPNIFLAAENIVLNNINKWTLNYMNLTQHINYKVFQLFIAKYSKV